jgi:hypothetical protein
MKKRTILLFLFLNIVRVFVAQNPDLKRTNHWYFGNGAGLDFSSGSPVAVTDGKLHTSEGSAVMSDTAGNLLFYTDGDTIWNKNHLPMLNGTGLFGCGNYGSTAQAALIVPKPQNDSIYYVFTNDCFENQGVKGFRYSVVNIYLDNGLGSVISKNNLLFSPSTEALAATRDSSGNGYWIMTHGYNTNNFYAFHLTDFGLDIVPVVSTIGLNSDSHIFTINFSPNSKKIAVTNPNVYQIDQIFDFNNETGELSNLINLSDNFLAGGSSQAIFSQDNSKLYFMYSGSYIYQYCLNTNQDSTSISSTVNIVASSWDNSTFNQFQQCPDGTIIIASQYSDSINFIKYPNKYGVQCEVSIRDFYLGGKQSLLGLPLFVQAYFEEDIQQLPCDSSSGLSDNELIVNNINLHPNPADEEFEIYNNSVNETNNIFKVQVLTEIGEIIYELKTLEKITKISTQNFNNGVYFVKIENEKMNSITKKIIINH